jgi:hypothetical protein
MALQELLLARYPDVLGQIMPDLQQIATDVYNDVVVFLFRVFAPPGYDRKMCIVLHNIHDINSAKLWLLNDKMNNNNLKAYSHIKLISKHEVVLLYYGNITGVAPEALVDYINLNKLILSAPHTIQNVVSVITMLRRKSTIAIGRNKMVYVVGSFEDTVLHNTIVRIDCSQLDTLTAPGIQEAAVHGSRFSLPPDVFIHSVAVLGEHLIILFDSDKVSQRVMQVIVYDVARSVVTYGPIDYPFDTVATYNNAIFIAEKQDRIEFRNLDFQPVDIIFQRARSSGITTIGVNYFIQYKRDVVVLNGAVSIIECKRRHINPFNERYILQKVYPNRGLTFNEHVKLNRPLLMYLRNWVVFDYVQYNAAEHTFKCTVKVFGNDGKLAESVDPVHNLLSQFTLNRTFSTNETQISAFIHSEVLFLMVTNPNLQVQRVLEIYNMREGTIIARWAFLGEADVKLLGVFSDGNVALKIYDEFAILMLNEHNQIRYVNFTITNQMIAQSTPFYRTNNGLLITLPYMSSTNPVMYSINETGVQTFIRKPMNVVHFSPIPTHLSPHMCIVGGNVIAIHTNALNAINFYTLDGELLISAPYDKRPHEYMLGSLRGLIAIADDTTGWNEIQRAMYNDNFSLHVYDIATFVRDITLYAPPVTRVASENAGATEMARYEELLPTL